jgi:transcriptional regulator with XRE-family HTH domain
MMAEGWKERLKAAIKADGRDLKAISLAAGLGPNFCSQFMADRSEPKLKQLLKLAPELGVSLNQIILGNDITPELEAFAQEFQALPPDVQAALLKIVKGQRSTQDS